jgi:hypothetical protein
LILIIYEINNIGVQNEGKLTGMNAEGAALAPSAGESPIHHSFGAIFLARPRAGFFYVHQVLRVSAVGLAVGSLLKSGYNHPSNNRARFVRT